MRSRLVIATALSVFLLAGARVAHAQDAPALAPAAPLAPALAPAAPPALAPAPAPAPAPSSPAAPNPDRLFAEAMALVSEERYTEAIPKLEEAQQIDPGIGTQFNLAVCYAKTGRLALAWRNFRQVEVLAGAAGKKERADAARANLEELRPRVAHVSLRVADPAAVTVRVDGYVIATEELGFVPLEQGEHKIEVAAAVRKPFEQTVTVVTAGESHEVIVPTLSPLESRTEIRTVTEETTNTRRTLGYVFGGVGLVGVATATVSGILILSDKSTADDRCKPNCVTATGEVDTKGADAVQRGKTLLPINIVAWVVAAAGIGAGGFFLLTAPKSRRSSGRTTIIPMFDARGGYSVVTTTF